MAILRQFGLGGGDFVQGAASFCTYAGQMLYKQPWGAKSDASTILLLPGFKGCFLDGDGGAHLCYAMRQLSMQALAMSGQPAFCIGVPSSGRFVPLTLFPVQSTFFHTSLFVKIVGIIGASLPLHLALQSPFFSGLRRQLLTERDQIGGSRTWYHRQG
jgi:hypothetical protein